MRKLILLFFLFSSPAYATPIGFLYDLFTDTDATALTSHTSCAGCIPDTLTWAQPTGTAITIVSNMADVNSATSTAVQAGANAAVPPTASYYCEGDVQATANLSSNTGLGVAVRRVAAANTYYICLITGGANGARRVNRIFRMVTGSATELTTNGQGTLTDWAVNTAYHVRLQVFTNASGNINLTCKVAGFSDHTEVDNNAAKLTGTGTGGFYLREADATSHGKIDIIQCDMLRANGRRIM